MSEIKVTAQTPQAAPSASTLAAPRSGFENQAKLEKAAKEFEGIFMDIVVKSMRNTVGESDVMGDSEKVKFFQSMLDTEYSKLSSDKNKLGLAQALIKQLSPRVEAEAHEKLRNLKSLDVQSLMPALPTTGGAK